MPQFPWSAPVPPLSAADGTPNTTASLADISPGGAVVSVAKTVYPGMLSVGTIVRLRARGEMTQGTTGNSLAIGFYWGGAAGVALAAATGLAVAASAAAWPWWMDWEGEIRALGTSGSIKGAGYVNMPASSVGLSADSPQFPIPQTAAARTVAIDTSVAKVVTVAGNFSAVTGGVSITCYSLTLELLG